MGHTIIEKQLRIQGMSCNHCVMALKKALTNLAGVQVKDVKVGSAVIAYDAELVPEESIRAAVEDAGYELVA